MKVEVCFSPALYKYYTASPDKIVVVTDIFRASTTMCAAFKNGAKAIIPVASIDEAKDYKAKGYKVGAERNVKRYRFYHHQWHASYRHGIRCKDPACGGFL